MKPMTRDLMLQVINDYMPNVPLVHQLERYVYVDNILKWLLFHGIRGQDFYNWVRIMHDGSILKMVGHISSLCNRTNLKNLYLGKDYR